MGDRPPPPPPIPQIRPPGAQGGPPPVMRPGPPPHPQMRQSTRLVDLTVQKTIPLDESTCFKKLTTYMAFTIRKAAVRDAKKDKTTWARSDVSEDKLSQEDMLKEVKKLNGKGKTVVEKQLALAPNQQSQVTHLLDDLISGERDPNFQWSLAQIDRVEKHISKDKRETVTMRLYVKRTPVEGINPVVLFQLIERAKNERLMALNRPPQQQQPAGPPQQGAADAGIVKMPNKSPAQGKRGGSRGPKKYHDHHSDSSSSSDYSSDSERDSDGSSYGTSVSSRSRDGKRNSKPRRRSFSRHEPRIHQKQYRIDDRVFSPEPRDGRFYAVPEVPRTVPQFDPVEAAYRAGKIDADTERFENQQREPRVIVERVEPAARIERPIQYENPNAIISYERRALPHRPPHRRYSQAIPRYEDRYEPGPRYVDDRYEDLRGPRFEEGNAYVRRARAAEDYIDNDYRRPRDDPRIVFTNSNPLAPNYRRPYSPSTDGW